MDTNTDQIPGPDDEKIDLIADKPETPKQHGDPRPIGEKNLAGLLMVLSVLLAAPVLLVHFIKAPPIDQDLNILGISYYHLVYIFFLSAEAIIVSSFLFYRFSAPVMLFIFAISLVAGLPLVIGLTQGLTLQQIILDFPSQTSLPFFLKPAYILIHFLLPIGALIFLFLQLRGILTRKTNSYAFMGAMVYLLAAAFIGFSALNQVGSPNMVNLLLQYRAGASKPVEQQLTDTAAPRLEESSMQPPAANPGSSAEVVDQPGMPTVAKPEALQEKGPTVVGLQNSELSEQPEKDKIDSTPEQTAIIAPKPSAMDASEPGRAEDVQEEPITVAALKSEIDHRLTEMDVRMEQVITVLEKLQDLMDEQRQKDLDQLRDKVAVLSDKVDRLILTTGRSDPVSTKQQVPPGNQAATNTETTKADAEPVLKQPLTNLERKVELLSDKLDRLAEILLQKDRPARPDQQ